MARRFTVRPVLRVFGQHVRRYPALTTYLAIARTAGITLGVIIPIYYKELLDAISSSGPTPQVAATLLHILWIIIALWLVRWLTNRSSAYANTYLQPHVMNDLSQTAFSSLLGHSYNFFSNNFSGSLVRKVTRLSRSFEQFADQIYDNILPLIVNIVGICIVLYLRSPIFGGIFLVWSLVVIAFQFAVAGWILKYNVLASARDSDATGVLSDAIGNDTTIKLFSGESYERSRYKEVSDDVARLRYWGWRSYEVVNFIQAFLGVVIEFVLLYACIRLWEQGLITIGDFVLVQSYIIAAIDQLWNVGGAIRRMYEAFADATEMVNIMNLPYEITDAPGARPIHVQDGAIAFRDVSFSFVEDRSVFSHFDLTIAPKEKIALVGPSGAGKTTVTKLLLRFHDIKSGVIEVDGQDISKVTQESLRDAIAFVPQEPVLFHRTLMENIRYGRRDATDEEVIEAAKQAHCYDFIMNTPEKFETFVGERGIKLSGGERQRVAIARAILKNAPILILDEATSSLDSESEMLIQDALARLMEGKTVIAIAHRLSTVMKMDRIIVIEDGNVAMTGTHAELLSHGGLYKKLWEIQAGGFIQDDLGATE